MNDFFEDVKKGLSSNPKFLSSKYFYDASGDELFQQLMNLEEYYLSRCELEILKEQSKLYFKSRYYREFPEEDFGL